MSDDKPPTGPVRLSINLSADAAEAIREITERRGITMTEAIRRSISIHKYIEDATTRGAKILIEEREQPTRELIFVL
jgi:ribbon-helix-helix CopG family protein